MLLLALVLACTSNPSKAVQEEAPAETRDGDPDGWSVEEGDCDDANAQGTKSRASASPVKLAPGAPVPTFDDGTTCERSGLGSDDMASAGCDLWNGYTRYSCTSSKAISFR